MIDICDFAVGLSRQLYGLTIATERPGHRNDGNLASARCGRRYLRLHFPVAVWSWNAALAIVCGNSVVWKPSEKTPLTALAVQGIFERAVALFGDAPEGLSQIIIGDRACGRKRWSITRRSAGLCHRFDPHGPRCRPRLAKRFARASRELGGNKAGIVCPSADLDMALRAIAFGAMGTAGQRARRCAAFFVHESVYDHWCHV